MDERVLGQVKAAIAARRATMTPDEARELAKRAKRFLLDRGRLPSINSPDAWERRMAEGVAFLQRMRQEADRG